MAKIVKLPNNLITNEDAKKLESYGSYKVVHGQATRFHWSENKDGDPVFDIFDGGGKDRLILRIGRHRETNEYYAEDELGHPVANGTLGHVMAALDKNFGAGKY